MTAHLAGAQLRAVWSLRVQNLPAGTLELYLADAGYVWNWAKKPAGLVPLAGVLDDSGENAAIPYRFFEQDSALDHVMAKTGFAFRGDCCLEAVH
jgi:hypothetical protein